MSKSSHFSILFTSVGRRVEFIQMLREQIPAEISLVCADASAEAPALDFGDKKAVLPPVTQDDFPGRLLDLCQKERVSVIVPLIDTELPVYASIKNEFLLFGIEIVVSDRFSIDLCRDKLNFSYFLTSKMVLCPAVVDYSQELTSAFYCQRGRLSSRSIDMKKISREEAVSVLKRRDYILTEWIDGQEYSIDILVNEPGKASIIVPRKRILVRDGESIIGETVEHEGLLNLSHHVVELLPGLYGPLCLQAIESNGKIYVTELNVRFGGGITLSIAAGASFADWLTTKVAHEEFIPKEWQSGKKMHRYLKGIYD